jgi:uncharacterized protein (DUF983 family)
MTLKSCRDGGRVTRGQIIARGLTNRCPNCGGRTLFRAGTLFELNRECARCGLRFERDEGFFLGSMSLNYGVTLIGFLGPVVALAWYRAIPVVTAVVLAGVGAMIVPALFYRSSRSWWLMNYYLFLPQHLPANHDPGTDGAAGDENR